MTITVAVTGGIGAGKSTVSGMLAARGAIVVDSDRLAREVVGVGTPGLSAIEHRFGDGVISGDGSLDRAALASIVFSDAGARKDLEAITHPLVRARFAAISAEAPIGGVVVNDIPLLTTLDAAANFHLVIGVGAPEAVRVGRLIDRGLTEPDARARIAAQIDDDARRKLCDVWIDNTGAPAQARRQTDVVWSRLVQFASNVESARVAGVVDGAGDARCPDRPSAVARTAARVVRAVEDQAVEGFVPVVSPVEAASGCLELEVTIAQRAQVDGWRPALTAAGFPRRDQPVDPVGDRLAIVHGSADPGQSVNVYFTFR